MFDNILEQYLTLLATTDRSHATQRAIRSDLTRFCTWWEHTHQRPFDLTQVVERDLRAWKVARQQVDGAAPATINRGLSTLRRVCAWAVEQKVLAENPTKGLEDIPATRLVLSQTRQWMRSCEPRVTNGISGCACVTKPYSPS